MYKVDTSKEPCAAEVTEPIRHASREPVVRRVFDCLCSGLGLLLLSPVLCLILLAIKFGDGGPVFYFQERIGRYFRPFRLIKFRTMVVGADKSGLLTAPGDSRVTPVGHFLRRYKLDELPQLINVLKGDMQLVGPRPEVERYVQMFRPEYTTILQERPGITDRASLAYRHEDKFLPCNDTESLYVSQILPSKLRMAMCYQQRRSFLSDMKVLFVTVFGLAKNT